MKNKVVWVIIIPIVVSVIGAAIYDWIKDFPFLHTASNVGIWLYNCLLSFLNAELKVWWVLLGIIIIIGTIYFWGNYLLAKEDKEKKLRQDVLKVLEEPPYIKYVSDRFNNLLWKWKWVYNEKKKIWEIDNLQPDCPNCHIPLMFDSKIRQTGYSKNFSGYRCLTCNHKTVYSENFDINTIEAPIYHKANNGIWFQNRVGNILKK